MHHPGLGAFIRKARREAGLNQTELAVLGGLHRNAVGAVESGRGSVETLSALAEALGLEISGRGLAGDGALGPRLLALRKRRRLSRRSVAAIAGNSIPAIEAVERLGTGHITSLELLGRAIGAGLCLIRKGTSVGFWASAASSSPDQEWYTPLWLMKRIVSAVGPIDTDPCSPGKGRSAVRAKLYFTLADDGLAQAWPGNVWMNPPYGRAISAWLEKARSEVAAGNSRCVTALIPARTDTSWWHDHVVGFADIVLLRGRITFINGAASAPFASAVLGYGLSLAQRDALFGAFPDAMCVPASPNAKENAPTMPGVGRTER